MRLKLFLLYCRYVQEVAEQHLVVQISSAIKGRVSVLDSAEEPEQLSEFTQRFKEGQPIQCRVSQVYLKFWHTLHLLVNVTCTSIQSLRRCCKLRSSFCQANSSTCISHMSC
jgi:acylphosphatase